MKWLQVFILIIAAEKLLELLEFAVVGASGNRLHAIISPFVNSVASAVGAGVSKAVHAAVFPAATLTSTPGDVCATERAAAYLWTACFVLLVLLSMASILYWHKHPLNPLSDKSSPSWVVADLKSRGWFSKCTWAVKALCGDLRWHARPVRIKRYFRGIMHKKAPPRTKCSCGESLARPPVLPKELETVNKYSYRFVCLNDYNELVGIPMMCKCPLIDFCITPDNSPDTVAYLRGFNYPPDKDGCRRQLCEERLARQHI